MAMFNSYFDITRGYLKLTKPPTRSTPLTLGQATATAAAAAAFSAVPMSAPATPAVLRLGRLRLHRNKDLPVKPPLKLAETTHFCGW